MVRCTFLGIVGIGCWLPLVGASNGSGFSGSVAYSTESIDRGRLVGKHSFLPHIRGVIYQESLGIYGDLDAHVPLNKRAYFPDYWKPSAGMLLKATEFFTLDVGVSHTLLRRQGFELLTHTTESYVGIRSNLLMKPTFYIRWDWDRHQWNLETTFGYDFDGAIVDKSSWFLAWENKLGFCKGRRPYGSHGPKRGYKYLYYEKNLFLKYVMREYYEFYIGPSFVYNSGGTQPWTVINAATYRNCFFYLCFGITTRQ
ncbi:MAG TPA: hypothetical protein DEW74_02845 [Opitutae bacterium]|nr:hypothetical protein [Opitutae bacterium]